MKKLTKQNINYLKSILNDMIFRQYSLENAFKYKIDIKTSFSETYETNKIIIIISFQLRKTSNGCYYDNFSFIENWLSTFESYYLNNDGTVEHKPITAYTLEKINIINDNIKEFFKNL